MWNRIIAKTLFTRRLLLVFGAAALLYPLVRFITHRVPRKPVVIKITDPLKQDRFLIKESFILFSKDGQLWAVSRSCTHLGCRLNFKEKEDILECPCHQSRFSIEGDVLNGPAKKGLQRFTVEKNNDPPYFLVST